VVPSWNALHSDDKPCSLRAALHRRDASSHDRCTLHCELAYAIDGQPVLVAGQILRFIVCKYSKWTSAMAMVLGGMLDSNPQLLHRTI
jgi:hypothetical protein